MSIAKIGANERDNHLIPNSARLKDAGPLMGQSSFIPDSDQSSQKDNSLSNHHCSDKVANNKRLPPLDAMTDQNSIYRKLYNRDINFFLWILERQEKAPYVFKLHVQANSKNEMKV